MKTITRNIAIMVMVFLLPSCRQSKPNADDSIAQQQVFPERTLNIDNQSDSVEKTVDTTNIENSKEYNMLTQQSIAVVAAAAEARDIKNHKHESQYAERKHTSELEEEYYDVFGKDFLDNIDDEEYDDAEEFDYEDKWLSMPQEVVEQRPVKPRGKFKKFNPQDF
ncbi:MAG: hypothetical protein IJP59_08825 [Muribaculaceae bacterium]|nr:hypothetical protein [Muribaculaceae bacterium]